MLCPPDSEAPCIVPCVMPASPIVMAKRSGSARNDVHARRARRTKFRRNRPDPRDGPDSCARRESRGRFYVVAVSTAQRSFDVTAEVEVVDGRASVRALGHVDRLPPEVNAADAPGTLWNALALHLISNVPSDPLVPRYGRTFLRAVEKRNQAERRGTEDRLSREPEQLRSTGSDSRQQQRWGCST